MNNVYNIENFDITDCSIDDIKEIKNLLEKHLVVVIKKQSTDPRSYARLVDNIGEIVNVNQWMWDQHGNRVDVPKTIPDYDTWEDFNTYPIQRVTGMKKHGEWTGIFGSGKLDWHCNLNGLDRADGVALQALEGCENTVTSWLNTANALADMPEDFVEELCRSYAEYEYAPDIWAKGLPESQLKHMMQNASKYKMWLIQENCVGVKGIYFYTMNRCNVVSSNPDLQEQLYNYIFQEKYMYHHTWETGDIVLSDQLLTLHKRQQDDPEILAKRVLNRITFKISNYNGFVAKRNEI
jgi:alpha-ketoglutarate-dependent taurine dioxygenase